MIFRTSQGGIWIRSLEGIYRGYQDIFSLHSSPSHQDLRRWLGSSREWLASRRRSSFLFGAKTVGWTNSKNRGTPKWMVYSGKPWKTLLNWMILGVPLFSETSIWMSTYYCHVFLVRRAFSERSDGQRCPNNLRNFQPKINKSIALLLCSHAHSWSADLSERWDLFLGETLPNFDAFGGFSKLFGHGAILFGLNLWYGMFSLTVPRVAYWLNSHVLLKGSRSRGIWTVGCFSPVVVKYKAFQK